MDHVERKYLKDVVGKIDNFWTELEVLQEQYGHNVKGMYIEDEETAALEIKIDWIQLHLGNLKSYIEQYIKEEESYSIEES